MRKRLTFAIFAVAVLLVLSVAIFCAYILVPMIPLLDGWSALLSRSKTPPYLPIFVDLLAMLLPIVMLAVFLAALIRFRRDTAEPLERASAFCRELADGVFPPPLDGEGCNPRAAALLQALNMVRDRLFSCANRLSQSRQREVTARVEAERRGELKSLLLARMMPDMRPPLNSIGGYAELVHAELEKDAVDPELLESYLQGVRRNIEAITQQLDRLVHISCADGRPPEEGSSVRDMADLLREVYDCNVGLLQKRSVKLSLIYSPSAPEKIYTDVVRLEELLMLMIRAVARAAGQGETVSYCCTSDREHVVFHVRDNRQAACREHLAEMYNEYRKDRELLPPEEASTTVLGVAFLADQALSLGGRVTALTTPEAYTELQLQFNFNDLALLPGNIPAELPRHVSSRHVPSRPSYSRAAEREQPPLPEDPDSRKFRILLGEEDRDNAEVMEKILKNNGFEVICRATAGELLELAAKEHFDAVVLSNAMRHRNMVDVIRQLREVRQLKLPIVAVVSKLTPAKRRQLQHFGVGSVYLKPLDFPALVKQLRLLCENHEEEQ